MVLIQQERPPRSWGSPQTFPSPKYRKAPNWEKLNITELLQERPGQG